jgi:acetyltransferase-like isoleucine patch superfamily enzyme
MMFQMRLFNFLCAKLFEFFYKSKFSHFGRRTRIVRPVAIEGPENIYLADDVYVATHSCLAARPISSSQDCQLIIEDGCRIGRFNHIYATQQVILRKKVLTANGVYISDNAHDYRDTQVAILDQPVLQNGPVEIGEGSWLGHNACILGVRIGRHCVVGANAVVTRDVPDFSVVVGVPAIIIKRFDINSGVWKPTHPDGSFI